MKKCIYALTLIILLFGNSAIAATITVTSNSNSKGVAGPCTVRDAIAAANADAASGGCLAGSGDDVINLPANVTITLVDRDDTGYTSGLPGITSNITINGNGSVIRRDPAPGCLLDGVARATDFRLITIASSTPATSRVVINDLTLSDGCDEISGGGAIRSNSGLTLNRVILKNNKSYLSGGGLLLSGYPGFSVPSLIDSCLIVENQSQYYGGGIYIAEAHDTDIRNSLIQANQSTGAGYSGGGVGINAARGTVVNSTITGNSAYAGAGINLFSPTASVAFSTIANNTNTGSVGGGGLYATSLPAELVGLILDGNSPSNCLYGVSPSSIYTPNLSSDMSCSFSIQGVGAQLLPLAFNGGNTQTMALTTGVGNAAINVANCQTMAGALTRDQRGHIRAAAIASSCDLGAYEEDGTVFSDSFDPLLR